MAPYSNVGDDASLRRRRPEGTRTHRAIYMRSLRCGRGVSSRRCRLSLVPRRGDLVCCVQRPMDDSSCTEIAIECELATVAYNVRFPGQIFDGQAGLHQNYFRDFDPGGWNEWHQRP
jgi:hypothetical protein